MQKYAHIKDNYIESINYEKGDDGIELEKFDLIEVNKGYEIHIDGENITYSEGDRFIKKSIEIKKELLNSMSGQELIDTTENFSDLGLTGIEKGKLLIDKFLDGNPYKESQYLRTVARIETACREEKREPTAQEQAILDFAKNLDSKIEVVLAKL